MWHLPSWSVGGGAVVLSSVERRLLPGWSDWGVLSSIWTPSMCMLMANSRDPLQADSRDLARSAEAPNLKGIRQVSSMIYSARPTASPVEIIVFAWNLFRFARFWEVGTYERKDNMCQNNNHYQPWLVDRQRGSLKLLESKANGGNPKGQPVREIRKQ